MRVGIVLVLVGCCVAPKPTPLQRAAAHPKPVDRTGDMMNAGLPGWVIKSYAEWVRYGYDKERD